MVVMSWPMVTTGCYFSSPLAIVELSLPSLPHRDRARVTVPMFNVDFQAEGRIDLSNDVVLAELKVPEAERVRLTHSFSGSKLPAPRFRLEIFIDADAAKEREIAQARLKQALQLLACTTNVYPVWLSVPVDRFVSQNERWERSSVADSSGGCEVAGAAGRHSAVSSFFGYEFADQDAHWRVTDHQVRSWSALMQRWPLPGRERRIDTALEYVVQALVDFLTDEHPAIVTAAISYEVLFGEKSAELSHRMAQRIAQLLSSGTVGSEIYKKAKTWYNARSRLMHDGRSAESELVSDFLTHQRAAVPAMLRLIQESGGHKPALDVLDEACFSNPEQLNILAADPLDAWWRFPLGSVAGLPPASAMQPRFW